jgi:hypothetical protein
MSEIPEDRDRVNLLDVDDTKYWLARFGCTLYQLELAVHAVGGGRVGPAADVENYLRDRGQFGRTQH